MRAKHLKRWLTKARKAAKDRETAATTTERVRPGMSEAQKGTESESDNWTRVVDLVQSAIGGGILRRKQRCRRWS